MSQLDPNARVRIGGHVYSAEFLPVPLPEDDREENSQAFVIIQPPFVGSEDIFERASDVIPHQPVSIKHLATTVSKTVLELDSDGRMGDSIIYGHAERIERAKEVTQKLVDTLNLIEAGQIDPKDL